MRSQVENPTASHVDNEYSQPPRNSHLSAYPGEGGGAVGQLARWERGHMRCGSADLEVFVLFQRGKGRLQGVEDESAYLTAGPSRVVAGMQPSQVSAVPLETLKPSSREKNAVGWMPLTPALL